jgi:hypothetical protein
VSPGRFAGFTAFAGDLADLDAIRKVLEAYQEEQVRPLIGAGLAPAYARADNHNNKVDLAPGSDIATVLDLTRLGRVYAEAKSTFKIPEFRRYDVTDPRDSAQINEFLGARLTDSTRVEPFLQAVLRARRRYRKAIETRVHPTWVAEWTSLKPFLDPDRPERWLQAVGVPRDSPTWVAVFRYPAARPGREIGLFRPTQLDAGWHAHHFPSPPQAAAGLGGHTMYLWQPLQKTTGIPASLICEYLHPQMDVSIAAWRAGGRLIGLAPPIGGDLAEQRHRHWLLLQLMYKESPVRDWMPESL